LVDLLFGDASPSGKLPISFPRTVGQVPIYYNAKRTGRPAKAGPRGIPPGTPLDPEGFDSSYIDVDVTPEFPFGFGLSYATFAYRDLRALPDRARVGQPVTVSVRVENTSDVPGVEVVQLYLRDRVASVTRPARELRRFERVALAPGEARDVRFTLERADFAFVGRDMKPVVEPGTFDVFAGGDSRAELSRVIELEAATTTAATTAAAATPR
ncbi:MAG: fibronectin type III-like domain-contianing protein, partial [Myxococcales bacterium]|nr:fibronectin type III-like domain-contianing protein [Myxococcales bacterium]